MLTKKTAVIGFIILLFCEIYIPSFKLNLVLQLFFVIVMFLGGNRVASSSFLNTIRPILIIFLIGFFGYAVYDYTKVDLVKDISHFTKPIAGLLVGFFVFYKNRNVADFFRAIIFVAAVTAGIHLFGILFFSDFFRSSVSDLRGDFGFDNFIEIFAFYILLFADKTLPQPLFRKKLHGRLILALLLLSTIIYFSRTMMVVLFLVGISLAGYARITAKGLRFIGIFAALVLLFYAYLFSIKLDRSSKGLEGFMYKVKIAPEEIFKTRIDRENHQELWDHWRGYEANRALDLIRKDPPSAILGKGYGSLVNLKFKAPLGEDGMRYISTLHNGYMYIFYKTGIVGLSLLIYFLGSLYFRVYRFTPDPTKGFLLKLISTIGLFYFFTSLIITGIYIPKDAIVMLLGGALAFERLNDFKRTSAS